MAITDTLGGAQEVNTVTEPGLYKLIFKSRTPEAKRFTRWVTHEVLPSLRRTGIYRMDEGIGPIPRRVTPGMVEPRDGWPLAAELGESENLILGLLRASLPTSDLSELHRAEKVASQRTASLIVTLLHGLDKRIDDIEKRLDAIHNVARDTRDSARKAASKA